MINDTITQVLVLKCLSEIRREQKTTKKKKTPNQQTVTKTSLPNQKASMDCL
jgi:hypothetical protein